MTETNFFQYIYDLYKIRNQRQNNDKGFLSHQDCVNFKRRHELVFLTLSGFVAYMRHDVTGMVFKRPESFQAHFPQLLQLRLQPSSTLPSLFIFLNADQYNL